jgi:predicted RND superfamily exporter protein
MPFIVIVLVVSIAVLSFVRFEFDAINYFDPSTQIARDFRTLNARLTGMLPFQVAVSGKHNPTSMLTQEPGMRKVIDISSIVRADDRLYWCLADNDSLAAIIDGQPRREAWAAQNSVTLTWLGVAAQLATGERLVRENAVAAIPTMSVLAGLAAILATGRLSSVWIGLVSALMPVAGLLLFVVVLRIPLGLPSFVIGGIAVGLSIDDTLHLTTTAQRRRSSARAVLECFRPCVGSSITAAACLMLFVMSPLAPIRQFGTLMALSAFIGMLVNQFVIPPFIAPRGAPRRSHHLVDGTGDE